MKNKGENKLAMKKNSNNFKRMEIKSIKQYFELTQKSELLPPWIVFSDMFHGSPRWNQGYEQDYCWNYWIPYWKNMSESEKINYCVKYNAPQEWIDWLNKNKDNF